MWRLLVILAFLAPIRHAGAQIVRDMIDAPVELSAPEVTRVEKAVDMRFSTGVVEGEFTGIAAQGFAKTDSLRGWVQFEGGEWLALYIVRSATDSAFLAAYRGEEVYSGVRFTLRFVVERAEDLTLVGAGVFDTRKDPPNGEAAAHSESDDFLVLAPQLWDRGDWQAAPFRGIPIPLARPSYNDITLHHTAGFSATTLDEGLEQVRRIQDFHQNGRGWSDIGYQFLMDQEGRLYQGRPFLNTRTAFRDGPPLAHGAHVGSRNTGNIGLSLMGCYHPPEGGSCRDITTDAARDSLLVAFAYLSERYGVPPAKIAGHRDFGATACPGDNNYADLPALRTDTGDLVRTGNARLGTADFSAHADEVGVVTIEWRFLSDNGIREFAVERVSGTSSDVVFTRSGAEDGTIVDAHAPDPGAVTYRLVVRGSRYRKQILGRADVEIPAAKRATLTGNFPNPFRGETTIRYFLERPGIVTLTVFDPAGRHVASLEDAWRDEDRWHAATFDAGGLPSGVYFYRVHVHGFADITYDAVRPLVVMQ